MCYRSEQNSTMLVVNSLSIAEENGAVASGV